MSNQPQLNPDALRSAADAVSELYADGHCPKAEDAAEVAVSAYLAAALPEVTSVEPQEHYLCVCGKYITLTKAGVLRHHRGKEKEYPGSPWSKVCEGAGKRP